MDKVTILLNEYNSLRGWVFIRYNHCFQFLAMAAPALSVVVAFQHSVRALSVVAACICIVGVIIGSWAFIDVRRAGDRLRELEEEINALAGANLLKWERTRGRGG